MKYLGDEYLKVKDYMTDQPAFIRDYLAAIFDYETPTLKEYMYLINRYSPSTIVLNQLRQAYANKCIADAYNNPEKKKYIKEQLGKHGKFVVDGEAVTKPSESPMFQ